MAPLPASGEQVEIAFGDQRAVVTEVGAGLRSYAAGGCELLDGHPAEVMSPSGRGQVLLPWPNRLQDGSYDFAGRRHQLAIDDLDEHHAIHGLVRWAGWTVGEREPSRVVMEHVLHVQPGYPSTLGIALEYSLSAEGLRVRVTATNLGSEPAPYGYGAHPYLTAGTPTVDTTLLRVPAGIALRSDERGIPVGAASVNGTELDFREPRAIGAARLDHAFTDLVRDRDGIARVGLRRPDDGAGLALWVDETLPYLMIFTGDPLPDVDRRSLAVEPMTCPPNAFRSGESLIVLEPGDSSTSTWGITPGP